MAQSTKKERAIIFIDGSNFYHLLKASDINPLGINFQRLSDKLILDRILVDTFFYIASVNREESPVDYSKQRHFLSKLTTWGIKVKYGRLETRLLTCNKCEEALYCKSCDKIAMVKKEKGVDVLLASEMIRYSLENYYDVAYLVSGDGDFSPAVEIVRKIANKRVLNVIPYKTKAFSLKKTNTNHSLLGRGKFPSFHIKNSWSFHKHSY